MHAAEIRRLAAEVSIQHGIRIDPNDPIMAVVTLNRLVLESALAESLSPIQKTVKELKEAAERVQIRAGSALAQEVRESASAMKAELNRDVERARLRISELIEELHLAQSRTRYWLWTAVGLVAGALLFFAGVCIGMLVR